jgi:hypothetical protein
VTSRMTMPLMGAPNLRRARDRVNSPCPVTALR